MNINANHIIIFLITTMLRPITAQIIHIYFSNPFYI